MSRVRNVLEMFLNRVFPSSIGRRATPEARRRLRLKVEHDRIEVIEDSLRKVIWLSRKNVVYVADMMDSFDYYFDSAASFDFNVAGVRFRVVDFSTPRYHKVVGFDDFPIFCPSLTEPYVTAQQYLDFASLKQGDNVIDLGCYSALTAIAFSKAVGPAGRVVALEPDPINFSAAQINLAQHERTNGLANVKLRREAAHGDCGHIRFSSEGAMGSAVASVVGDSRGDLLDVPAVTLEQIAASEGLDRVAFVKMDIEGAELPVLGNSRDFLERFRPRLIVEPHVVEGKLTDRALVELLTSTGYSCQVITQHGVSLPLVAATWNNSGSV